MSEYDPVRLTERHKEAIRMSVLCEPDAKIAKVTGMSQRHITRVRNSRKGREYGDKLGERLDHACASLMANPILLKPGKGYDYLREVAIGL